MGVEGYINCRELSCNKMCQVGIACTVDSSSCKERRVQCRNSRPVRPCVRTVPKRPQIKTKFKKRNEKQNAIKEQTASVDVSNEIKVRCGPNTAILTQAYEQCVPNQNKSARYLQCWDCRAWDMCKENTAPVLLGTRTESG